MFTFTIVGCSSFVTLRYQQLMAPSRAETDAGEKRSISTFDNKII